jgi:hypothetical protein
MAVQSSSAASASVPQASPRKSTACCQACAAKGAAHGQRRWRDPELFDIPEMRCGRRRASGTIELAGVRIEYTPLRCTHAALVVVRYDDAFSSRAAGPALQRNRRTRLSDAIALVACAGRGSRLTQPITNRADVPKPMNSVVIAKVHSHSSTSRTYQHLRPLLPAVSCCFVGPSAAELPTPQLHEAE